MTGKSAFEADYVVVGGGAVGMSFVDVILAESDATVIMVDRRAHPGGHWNDAYLFVRLHEPSGFYGVNSTELGRGGRTSRVRTLDCTSSHRVMRFSPTSTRCCGTSSYRRAVSPTSR